MTQETNLPPPDMRVFTGAHVNKIFVYGTLKRTYLRHSSLDGCKFVGEDSLKGYLFDWGAFPAFVPEVTGTDVLGEVYEYDDKDEIKILGRLDAIEGVPSLYWRLPFLTAKGHTAWTYLMPYTSISPHRRLIYTGKWIGPNSPKCDLGLFLAERPEACWPRKPKMKFHGPARCIVVQQDPEIQKDCMDYPLYPTREQAKQIILAEKYSSRNSEPEPQTVEIRPQVVKKESIVALEWLGDPDSKTHEVCNETNVEGI